MSDNISQLHPQKHPGLGKRIAVFAVLLVFVTGGVAAYVFRDRLNLDALQRYVRYLNVSEDSKTGRFVYDESRHGRRGTGVPPVLGRDQRCRRHTAGAGRK